MEQTSKRCDSLRRCSTQELETLLCLSVSDNTVTEAEIWTALELLNARAQDVRPQARETEAAWNDFLRREAAGAEPRAEKPARRRIWPMAAAIAAVVVLCTSAALAADSDALPQWMLQQWDRMASDDSHYSAIEEDARIAVNETQSCEQQNISMTVEEMILEDHHLLVQATFRHLSGEEDVLSTSELPWDVFLCQDGEELLYVGSESVTAATVDNDTDEQSILYTIDLGELDGGTLLGKELTVSFSFTSGGRADPDAGQLDFTITPTQCVEEQHYEVGTEYSISQGTLYVDSVETDAIHITLNAELRCPEQENRSYEISLQTEDGFYDADRVQSGENYDAYLFPRLQDGSDSLTFVVTALDLTLADENGALLPEAEQELGCVTVPLK